jgi:hypothetical protein
MLGTAVAGYAALVTVDGFDPQPVMACSQVPGPTRTREHVP